MKDMQDNQYFMEHAKESRRLSVKVDPKHVINTYLAKHFNSIDSLLEVACGPGVILEEAARAYPSMRFVGLDFSIVRLQDALQRINDLTNVSIVRGDALKMSIQSNCFDLIFSRFLLQYLPKPVDAVAEMVRVCKPGGKIVLQDLDGQLQWFYPEDADLKERIDRVVSHLQKATGFDPFVGRKLFTLLKEQGVQNINVRADSYNLFWGPMDDKNFQLWATKLEIAMPAMIEVLGGAAQAEKLKKDCLDYFRRDDTLVYSVVFTVTGEKSCNTC